MDEATAATVWLRKYDDGDDVTLYHAVVHIRSLLAENNNLITNLAQTKHELEQAEAERDAIGHMLGLCELALRVAHLPLPPYEPEHASLRKEIEDTDWEDDFGPMWDLPPASERD